MTTYINDYDLVKNAIESNKVRNIFNLADGHFVSDHEFEYGNPATIIFELVKNYGEGFVVDICTRVLDSIKNGRTIVLSEKQRWCVAFAAIKIAAEMVDEIRKADEEFVAELEAETVAEVEEPVVENNDTEEVEIVDSINVEDIRLVNEFQESGRVFIHTKDGRTILRTMMSSEVCRLQTIRNREGLAAFHRAVAEIFNKKYAARQKFIRIKMTAAEEEYFLKVHTAQVTGVWPDEI